MTRTEWLALAERCEAATGPDTELDAAIACAVHGWTQISEEIDPYGDVPMLIDRDGGGPMIPCEYTASIDAITALIERDLPGGAWSAGMGCVRPDEPVAGARLFSAESRYFCIGEAEGRSPALALCAAFCHAKAERAET